MKAFLQESEEVVNEMDKIFEHSPVYFLFLKMSSKIFNKDLSGDRINDMCSYFYFLKYLNVIDFKVISWMEYTLQFVDFWEIYPNINICKVMQWKKNPFVALSSDY